MRSVCASLLGFALLAGCKPEPFRPDAAPPYWKPKPGEAADWDIQLNAPFDLSAPRAMYALELWDVIPDARSVDYGDGTPLMVPAGAQRTAIADLKARPGPPIVVCHLGAGTIRLDDPDASKFPGFAASPPNRPDPVASGSVIGWSISDTDANERFLDIRDPRVAPLILKRIELAQQIGCDAIAAKDTDLPAYQSEGSLGHGFGPVGEETISLVQYRQWSEDVAAHAHTLRMSAGIRNKSKLAGDDLAAAYDWAIVERCAEYELRFCDAGRPFINANKPAFAIEYDQTEEGDPNDPTALCSDLDAARIEDGIIKNAALSSAYYMRCM